MSLSVLFEHSKKIGRWMALTIILGVAGAIAIIGVVNDPTSAREVGKDWLALGGIAVTFYFLTAPKKP